LLELWPVAITIGPQTPHGGNESRDINFLILPGYSYLVSAHLLLELWPVAITIGPQTPHGGNEG